MKYTRKRKRGFTVIEIVVAIGIFAIISSSVAFFSIDANRISQNIRRKSQALMQIQESINALEINKGDSWSSVIQNTSNGSKYISFSNNHYSISSGTTTSNGITYSFTFDPVYRDVNGNIVSSGGTQDIHSRAINSTATWTDIYGVTNTLTSINYINDWNTINWTQTTVADFTPGTRTNTIITNDTDGEVALDTIIFADWCKPSLTTTNVNLSGQGVPTSVSAISNSIVVGTGANASGVPFAQISTTNTDPPTATVTGQITSGFKTNEIFRDSNYAYAASDTNSQEIEIIGNPSSASPSIVGYFDAPGNGNGSAVYAVGTVGYMTTGNKFYTFDLTSGVGSRPRLNSLAGLTLAGTGQRIIVSGNYAYVVTNSTTTQLQVVDISNPASPTIVGQASVNGLGGVDVAINSDATRAYLATAVSSTQKELFVLNISTKTGNIPTISSYESNSMNPTGVIIAAPTIAILVGKSGTQQYQVINISNDTPVNCGGLAITNGINGIATAVDGLGNAYSYIVTNNSGQELKIIKGGPGGGNGQGQGYPSNGTFISSIFDTTSTTSTYNSLDWTVTLPPTTSLKMQLRTGSSTSGTTDNINNNTWVGPDGTSNTYFTTPSGSYIPNNLQGKRYIQYQAYFTADTNKINTPILQLVKINYQK